MADNLKNVNYKMCFKFYAVNNVPKNYAKSHSKERKTTINLTLNQLKT
jgi:hypothetical protein